MYPTSQSRSKAKHRLRGSNCDRAGRARCFPAPREVSRDLHPEGVLQVQVFWAPIASQGYRHTCRLPASGGSLSMLATYACNIRIRHHGGRWKSPDRYPSQILIQRVPARSTSCRLSQRRVFGWIIELLLVDGVWRVLLLPGYGSPYRFIAFDQLAVAQFGPNPPRAWNYMLSRIAR
jgi:hypothetical protein